MPDDSRYARPDRRHLPPRQHTGGERLTPVNRGMVDLSPLGTSELTTAQ